MEHREVEKVLKTRLLWDLVYVKFTLLNTGVNKDGRVLASPSEQTSNVPAGQRHHLEPLPHTATRGRPGQSDNL